MDALWFVMELIVRLFELAGLGILLVVVAHEAGSNRQTIQKIFNLLFEYDDFDANEEDLII